MKLSRITGLLAGAGILAAAQVALASDGTITFNGEITASTCDIVNSGGPDFDVDLPTVSTSTLDASGKTAGWTQFDIELANCTGSLSNVMAYFEAGPNVDTARGHLNNTIPVGAGGATEVQIALRDAHGAGNIVIGSPGNQTVDVSGGSGVLSYEAGYFATGAATAGAVESSVTYSLVYQ
ncbi:fimbrial protein [Bordetella petrii]|uniref:fimbrial protein n=1 Tax=Bordetella petrii TaxID=94624 RepID=UPI001A963694|nr:fimbrial protein [Bordetella petrii]MBO1114224.1 type 1 fimbrial protein [Bordetella petrii]